MSGQMHYSIAVEPRQCYSLIKKQTNKKTAGWDLVLTARSRTCQHLEGSQVQLAACCDIQPGLSDDVMLSDTLNRGECDTQAWKTLKLLHRQDKT